MPLLATLHRFKSDWRLLGPLLVLNLAGMVFGWYYYWDVGQFNPSSTYYQSPAWWVLVADSPNAVLLFFVAALAYKLSAWRSRWLDAAAFILNVYVGLWTTFLFLAYPDRMGTFDYASVPDGNANPILFLAHMGMPLQALVLMQDMRRDAWTWMGRAIVVVAAVVYIAVDYWGPMLHPAPFLHPEDAILHAGAPWLMVLAAALWLASTMAGPGGRGEDMAPHQ